jgi:hypothetical protein
MDENNAFAAIRFWLGWNCQLLDEGGVLHWRKEAPQADAGPILFAAASGEKAGDFQRETRRRMIEPPRRHQTPRSEKSDTKKIGSGGHRCSKKFCWEGSEAVEESKCLYNIAFYSK